MKLRQLHEQFIEMAGRPMSFGSLPVQPLRSEAPVIAVNRWTESNGSLYKTYQFRRQVDRNDFIIRLLAYESQNGHHAQIRIDDGSVDVKVTTKNVNNVTELDKEYACYADVLFRELVYSPRHEDES